MRVAIWIVERVKTYDLRKLGTVRKISKLTGETVSSAVEKWIFGSCAQKLRKAKEDIKVLKVSSIFGSVFQFLQNFLEKDCNIRPSN